MSYKVGQVLYLLLKDSRKVVSIQVVEEVVRKTVEGKTVDYLAVQNPGSEKRINLERISHKAEIYESLSDLKSAMISKATAAIEQMISETQESAVDKFGEESVDSFEDLDDVFEEETSSSKNKTKKSQKKTKKKASIEIESDDNEVILESGQRVKIGKIQVPEGAEDLLP